MLYFSTVYLAVLRDEYLMCNICKVTILVKYAVFRYSAWNEVNVYEFNYTIDYYSYPVLIVIGLTYLPPSPWRFWWSKSYPPISPANVVVFCWYFCSAFLIIFDLDLAFRIPRFGSLQEACPNCISVCSLWKTATFMKAEFTNAWNVNVSKSVKRRLMNFWILKILVMS
jgi:hypothetical protein